MKRNRLLLFASFVQLFLFVVLARWVRTHEVNHFDVKMTRSIQKRPNPVFSALSWCCSVLCSWQFVNLLALPLTVVLWRSRLRLEAVMFGSVAVLGTVFRKLLQRIVARPRPFPPLAHVTKKKSSPSFPSGHAATSIIGGGWLLMLSGLLLKGKQRWQKALASGIAFMMVSSGPSRIYLGEHWTSDVVGGYVYGGALLSLSFSLYFTLKDNAVLVVDREVAAPKKHVVQQAR
jgi:membrane-associated phospholipid phosphatase